MPSSAPPSLPPADAWYACLGTWSRPADTPSRVAAAAAVALLVLAIAPGGPAWVLERIDFGGATPAGRRRRFLVVFGFVAAFLSLGYIAFYLRGGPRSAEGAVTWLQGRALSHGDLAWASPEPAASYRAKNLLPAAPGMVAGVVPPGYPALLATTFLLGAPMLIGPLLAAALAAATWFLAREAAAALGEAEARRETVGRVALGFSILSAALRYHTAETAPYGAAALATALALACALRASRTGRARLFGLAGLAFGAVVATTPVAALPLGLGIGALVALGPHVRGSAYGRCARALAWAGAGAVPGFLLLALAQRAATGHLLAAPIAVYRALYDASAVHPRSARTVAVALACTVRGNLGDVANLELLALVPLFAVPALRRRGRPAWAIGALALVVAGELAVAVSGAARVPGAHAGAPGAAALAGVLPIEHALLALALVLLFERAVEIERAVLVAFAVALAGFAVHASFEHARVAAGGLGRPRFEPDVAREGGVNHGLLFFEDAEGFELAHDPAVAASHGLAAVRMHNDDHDRLLYDLLGHPPSHRYVTGPNTSSVVSWSTGASDTWRFETEADFPTEAPWGGSVETLDAPGSCASGGAALALTPAGPAGARVRIDLPVPRGTTPAPRRSWTVAPRAFLPAGAGGASAELDLVSDVPGEPPLAQWSWSDSDGARSDGSTPRCVDLPPRTVELGGDRPRAWLVLTARGGPAALDKATLRPH